MKNMSLLRQIVQLPIKQSKLTCVVIQTRGAAGGGKKAKGSVGKTKKVQFQKLKHLNKQSFNI